MMMMMLVDYDDSVFQVNYRAKERNARLQMAASRVVVLVWQMVWPW
jgi:hypothetical protein